MYENIRSLRPLYFDYTSKAVDKAIGITIFRQISLHKKFTPHKPPSIFTSSPHPKIDSLPRYSIIHSPQYIQYPLPPIYTIMIPPFNPLSPKIKINPQMRPSEINASHSRVHGRGRGAAAGGGACWGTAAVPCFLRDVVAAGRPGWRGQGRSPGQKRVVRSGERIRGGRRQRRRHQLLHPRSETAFDEARRRGNRRPLPISTGTEGGPRGSA